MDADVGMSELDLIYMKGTKAHSGFPEVRTLKTEITKEKYSYLNITSILSICIFLYVTGVVRQVFWCVGYQRIQSCKS